MYFDIEGLAFACCCIAFCGGVSVEITYKNNLLYHYVCNCIYKLQHDIVMYYVVYKPWLLGVFNTYSYYVPESEVKGSLPMINHDPEGQGILQWQTSDQGVGQGHMHHKVPLIIIIATKL